MCSTAMSHADVILVSNLYNIRPEVSLFLVKLFPNTLRYFCFSMASRYCQKPFEFEILVQPDFSLGKLQILSGELGTCMGEFNIAMVEFLLGRFGSR